MSRHSDWARIGNSVNTSTGYEHDSILEGLERWKKRVFAAFQLLAVIIGAAALLLLELGVLQKAWILDFKSPTPTGLNLSPQVETQPGPHVLQPKKQSRKKKKGITTAIRPSAAKRPEAVYFRHSDEVSTR